MRWHLSPWYPWETLLSIPFSISFTQFGSVWNFNSSANCRSRKGVIICLSGLQLGGAPAGWVFPFTASCVANVLELVCFSSCTAPGGIEVDADFGSCGCVCDSVCGWAKTWQDGWFAVTKIVACFCGFSHPVLVGLGEKHQTNMSSLYLSQGTFLSLAASCLKHRSYSMHASAG